MANFQDFASLSESPWNVFRSNFSTSGILVLKLKNWFAASYFYFIACCMYTYTILHTIWNFAYCMLCMRKSVDQAKKSSANWLHLFVIFHQAMGLRERRYTYRDFITPKQTRRKVSVQAWNFIVRLMLFKILMNANCRCVIHLQLQALRMRKYIKLLSPTYLYWVFAYLVLTLSLKIFLQLLVDHLGSRIFGAFLCCIVCWYNQNCLK